MNFSDLYTLRARVQPTIMVALPVIFVVYALLPDYVLFVTAFLGLLGVAGGNDIVAHVGRERGYKKQDDLWASWDGPPTTRLLRHRHIPGDIALAPELRQQFESWLGYALPTQGEEEADPIAADEKYKNAIGYLLEATRDASKFPLVSAENANYGFRRNLWGLRSIGIPIAVVLAFVSWVLLLLTIWERPWPNPWWDVFVNYDSRALIWILVGLANTGITVVWIFLVKSSWVKITADTYARQLMKSVEGATRSDRGKN